MKNLNNSFKGFLWLSLLFLVAAIIASSCKIEGLKLLDFEFVATTVGIILGFGLTIYTFILQLLQPLIERLKKRFEDEDKKKRTTGLLISSEKELRQDLWLIFFSLVIVLIVGIVSNSVELRFNFGLHDVCYLPQTVYIFVYLICFRAFYDLISSLFAIGEITIQFLTQDTENTKDAAPK